MNSKMDDHPEYFDLRSSFWRSCFETAVEYESYLNQSPPQYTKRWLEAAKTIPPLTEEQKQKLRGHHRILNVLLVSGVWCGDCVRQGPMLKQIVDACEDWVELRVMDRESNVALRDELRIMGAARVPVAVFLTEDFFEVGRFGDRMLTTYREMVASQLRETRPASPVTPGDKTSSELAEWVDIFERMLLMTRLSPLLRRRHGD